MKNIPGYILSIVLGIIVGILIGVGLVIWVQAMEEEAEKREGESASIVWRQNHFILSKENLHHELMAQGVDFPNIVQAQAILETGHFKSYACLHKNNLFGLRNGDGTYMSFAHWTLAVAAYKKHIQKYAEPPNDYYQYLEELGYAEDSSYIAKLKEIVSKE